MSSLAEQSYWDNAYDKVKPFQAADTDPLVVFLREHLHLAKAKTESCLEIGCYPGRYLPVLGSLGYILNGIDLTPRVEIDLKPWLESLGHSVGTIKNENVFDLTKTKDQYDLVVSFGFIEHFVNWEEVLSVHMGKVKPNGRLIVTAPNFRGLLQHTLHRLLDAKNLSRHYVPSMKPHKWAEIARSKGFEVEFEGYFGGYDFWVDEQARSKVQLKLLSMIERARPFLEKLPEGNGLYSPFCGLVAQKKA